MLDQRYIVLTGQAGSGKDTVASYLAEHYNAVSIGLADPMKRFIKAVFGFSDDQLWGPSASRNAIAPHTVDPHYIDIAINNFNAHSKMWVDHVIPPSFGAGAFFDACAALHKWMIEMHAREGGLSVRIALQTLGTSWGRESVHTDIWVDYLRRTGDQLFADSRLDYSRSNGIFKNEEKIQGPSYVAISDGRFSNEIAAATYGGGTAIRIVRKDIADAARIGITNHRSEVEQTEIPDSAFTAVIINDGTKEELFAKVDQIMLRTYGGAL